MRPDSRPCSRERRATVGHMPRWGGPLAGSLPERSESTSRPMASALIAEGGYAESTLRMRAVKRREPLSLARAKAARDGNGVIGKAGSLSWKSSCPPKRTARNADGIATDFGRRRTPDMELLKYEEARAALAACVKIDEARNIRDTAEAIRAYARQANDTEIESRAAEIKLRALRRLGELSREMPRAKPGGTINGKKGGAKIDCPGGGQSKNDALADAGITRQQANRCEIIASLPEEHFEAKINAAKALGRPLRIPDVEREAKKHRQERISPADQPPEPVVTPLNSGQKAVADGGERFAALARLLGDAEGMARECIRSLGGVYIAG